MRGIRIAGLILIAAGAIMAFFVKQIVRNSTETISSESLGYRGEILSKYAMIFKITGFVAVVIGTIMFFY